MIWLILQSKVLWIHIKNRAITRNSSTYARTILYWYLIYIFMQLLSTVKARPGNNKLNDLSQNSRSRDPCKLLFRLNKRVDFHQNVLNLFTWGEKKEPFKNFDFYFSQNLLISEAVKFLFPLLSKCCQYYWIFILLLSEFLSYFSGGKASAFSLTPDLCDTLMVNSDYRISIPWSNVLCLLKPFHFTGMEHNLLYCNGYHEKYCLINFNYYWQTLVKMKN